MGGGGGGGGGGCAGGRSVHRGCVPQTHTPSIAFRHLPPKEEGCRKPVFGVLLGR